MYHKSENIDLQFLCEHTIEGGGVGDIFAAIEGGCVGEILVVAVVVVVVVVVVVMWLSWDCGFHCSLTYYQSCLLLIIQKRYS